MNKAKKHPAADRDLFPDSRESRLWHRLLQGHESQENNAAEKESYDET
jgi:hypothetical protein